MNKIIIALIYIFMINTCSSFGISLADKANGVRSKDLPSINKTQMKRVFVGGDIGVTFGDYTEVRLSPLIGYRFSPHVLGGLKFVYRHSWDKIGQNTSNETTLQSNSYGGNVFLQYNPISQFYVKAEYSYQVYKTTTTLNGTEDTGVPFLFLGLGYTKALAPNVYLNAGIEVDVLNNDNSPFESFTPFFDVSIGFGI
ncbi:MAG: hypothetical protein ABI462_13185 [Ignavibacteria bacterium]